MTISIATYFSARTELLIAARRYLSWARNEPQKCEHFLGWRKLKQRQLAMLRSATRVAAL